jgi:SAM-dependent methyltransferase
MQVIRSIAELDAKIDECNRAEAISDDAMRAVFGTFCMAPPHDLPEDPFAEEYRQAQLTLYRGVAERDYAVGNEVTAFDIDQAVQRPFPFATGSSQTTGEQLMAIGFLLRTMALPQGSSIVEFGPGWGNTSLFLAKLGYRLTVVDIEPHFCELIRRRAAIEGVEIDVVNDDFFWVERSTARYDAALFFECFHHCADHMRLLRALDRAIVPGGKLFFGGEPISPDFPMPWGLRLDGNSLWAIRKNGWLELGFRDDYFRDALRHAGWRGQRVACADPQWMHLWCAQRSVELVFQAELDDPRMNTEIGRRYGTVIELPGEREGTGLYGPYIDLPAGQYEAQLHFRGHGAGQAVMDIAAEAGARILAQCPLRGDAIGRPARSFSLGFEVPDGAGSIEVRLLCQADFRGVIEGISIFAR